MTTTPQKPHELPARESAVRALPPGIPHGRPKMPRLGRRRAIILGCQLALLFGVLAIWELGASFEPDAVIDQFTVSKPSAIWDALVAFEERGVLWSSILVTYRVTLIGFIIGGTLGFLFGLILGVQRFLAAVLNPFIGALYSTPRLALIPLFILWFGIGDGSKIALVASVTFFLVFYATFAGVKEVDPEIIERMRLMRASRRNIGQKAILPSATSYIIEGLSVSAPFALVAAVTAEMLSSNRGMGFLLVRSAGQFNTAGVFACITVLALMGILLMGLTRVAEGRLLRWKPGRVNRAK